MNGVHGVGGPAAVDFSSIVDVCEFIDSLPSDAAGELSLAGSTSQGTVFIEGGRVCWAAARGLAQRLSKILAARARVSTDAMEDLYDACKRRRVPLGEHLVETGLVTATDLRAALLQHTSESLHALCAGPQRGAWSSRRSGAYSARYTFPTSEILAMTQAEANRDVARSVTSELAESFSAGDWGAAYVRVTGCACPVPVAISGAFPPTIEPLLRLGRWAASAIDVSAATHAGRTFIAATIDETSLVAWQHDAGLIAGVTSRHGPARLLNRRARARRQEVDRGDF